MWATRHESILRPLAFSGDLGNEVIQDSFRNGTGSYLMARAQNINFFYPEEWYISYRSKTRTGFLLLPLTNGIFKTKMKINMVIICCVMLTNVLVTLLLLWRHAAIKAVYKRKHLARVLLTVSENKSLIIMMGHTAAVSHGAGAAAYCLHLEATKKQREEQNCAWSGLLKPQSPAQGYTSSKATSPQPSKAVPPSGNKAFKYISLRVILIILTITI